MHELNVYDRVAITYSDNEQFLATIIKVSTFPDGAVILDYVVDHYAADPSVVTASGPVYRVDSAADPDWQDAMTHFGNDPDDPKYVFPLYVHSAYDGTVFCHITRC